MEITLSVTFDIGFRFWCMCIYVFGATVLTSRLATCISLYGHDNFKAEIARLKK